MDEVIWLRGEYAPACLCGPSHHQDVAWPFAELMYRLGLIFQSLLVNLVGMIQMYRGCGRQPYESLAELSRIQARPNVMVACES